MSTTGYRKHLEAAQAEASRQRAALEGQYEQDKAELQGQFQFAETDAERKMLGQALGELERQREVGTDRIAAGYNRAVVQVGDRADGMGEQTAGESAAVGDLYRGAADQIAGQQQVAQQAAAGGGLGVNTDGGGGAASDWQAMVAAAAPREQALTQRLGDIRQEDVRWLADSLQGESQSQQADLAELVTSAIAQQQMQHQAQVQQRIGQERMAWTQQLGGLQGDYRGRGFQLDDTQIGTLQQLAEMEQKRAEAAAERSHASALQQAQLAAAAREGAAGRAAAAARARASGGGRARSGGGGGGGMPSPGSLAGSMFALDVYDKYGPAGGSVLQQHGYDVSPMARQTAGNAASNAGSSFGGMLSNIGKFLRSR